MTDKINKERYDVLDQNGDVLFSSASWGLASTYLASWRRPGYYAGTNEGTIRDNEDQDQGDEKSSKS